MRFLFVYGIPFQMNCHFCLTFGLLQNINARLLVVNGYNLVAWKELFLLFNLYGLFDFFLSSLASI